MLSSPSRPSHLALSYLLFHLSECSREPAHTLGVAGDAFDYLQESPTPDTGAVFHREGVGNRVTSAMSDSMKV